MATFIVRVWMDFKVKADSEAEAQQIMDDVDINSTEKDGVEYYDSQYGGVWLKQVDETEEAGDELHPEGDPQ